MKGNIDKSIKKKQWKEHFRRLYTIKRCREETEAMENELEELEEDETEITSGEVEERRQGRIEL